MKTMQNRKLVATLLVVVVSLAAISFVTSIQAGEKKYEVRPDISIPFPRTEASHAIDSYERMMERFMDMTDRNLSGVGSDVKSVQKELSLMNIRLLDISMRIEAIEKTLATGTSGKKAEKKSDIKAPKLPMP
jgi:hypothetical protein